MKKTETKKTRIEGEKEAVALKKEIVQLKIEKKVNPQKDTNLLMKKRKKLAQILTVIHSQK